MLGWTRGFSEKPQLAVEPLRPEWPLLGRVGGSSEARPCCFACLSCRKANGTASVPQGDESAAVLALHWLVQSTSQAGRVVAAFGQFPGVGMQVSRPPLWDTIEAATVQSGSSPSFLGTYEQVERHRCQAQLDSSMQVPVLSAWFD